MGGGTGLNLDESQVADCGVMRDTPRFSIKRSAVSVTCTISSDEEDSIFQGTLEDISSSGLCMSTRYPLKKETVLEFAFDVDGSTQVREGRVMWVRVMGVIYKVGVKFLVDDITSGAAYIEEGLRFPCTYKLNISHNAEATVVDINNSNLTIVVDDMLGVGTVLEIIINPWVDKSNGVFDIRFADVFKISENWKLWDIHKVAKVSKVRQIADDTFNIMANFISNKRR